MTIPVYGGTINEGVVGTSRFINPTLATTDVDKDLTTLIFSGLTKRDQAGKIILDLADSIKISEDGLRYTVIIKNNVYFHDNRPVTSDDVIFTISKIQNPIIKSPKKIEWEGVSIEKISDKEIIFTLKQPFPLFMETLGVGVLPKHLWKNLSDDQFSLTDLNVKAVGSGPYMITDITLESGIPTKIELAANSRYALGRPFIASINFGMYQNEKYLLKDFSENIVSRVYDISPQKIQELNINEKNIHTSLLPRTFAIFFNPNKSSPLSDKNIRKALELSIDKERIIKEVLSGYGTPLHSPYPFDTSSSSSEFNIEEAKKLLSESKHFKNASSTFDLTLTTANTEVMRAVADFIKKSWEPLGVNVTVKIYDVSDLNQNIIKDRDFETLLFGAITQSPSDLYAFWHSSQRTYPGLNISNYVSKHLDENLEILRSSIDSDARENAYAKLREEFKEEVPGIFLFSPSLVYVTQDKSTTILPEYSYDNSSRFTLVETWHLYKERVWPATYYRPLLQTLQNILH